VRLTCRDRGGGSERPIGARLSSKCLSHKAHLLSPLPLGEGAKTLHDMRLTFSWRICPCRPSSPSGLLALASSVSRARVRAMTFHISSSCTWVTGRGRSRGVMASACWAARFSHANTVSSVTPSPKPIPARSTRTRSILRAIMTFSSEVRRADRIAGLSKERLTWVTTQDPSLAALRERGGDSAHVALLYSSIMRTRGIGARVAPIFGLPHRSILRCV
jgi:hypothetical protein